MNKEVSTPSGTPVFNNTNAEGRKCQIVSEGRLPQCGHQARVRSLIDVLCEGMFEREEIISVALLGAMCGQNIFLFGPPGTAKSLISRRIASAFERPDYFEYLMNRFSTPEEVFGPVSIKDLKADRYTRKTENYLPTAEFAFLDEIWKSSPAILNTLLTLVNEHIFRNGTKVESAPLKALIAASNETPEPNQGLEALFDRFIVRLLVGPIEDSGNFECLLNSKPTEAEVDVPEGLAITKEEWADWRNRIHNVSLSKETFLIIGLIRAELAKRYDELKVYVSDRRWQRAATLMKASAFFNDRAETNHSDAILLQHCLWTHADNRDEVMDIVAQAIKEAGFDSGFNLADLDRQKDSLDKEIGTELYHTEDVYDTVDIGSETYCKVQAVALLRQEKKHEKTFYIPFSKMKTNDKFHPVDGRGNEIQEITCDFDGQGTCKFKYDKYNLFPSGYYNSFDIIPKQFQPRILFKKGDKKVDINARLVKDLKASGAELRRAYKAALLGVKKRFEGYDAELASPFVPKAKSQIALAGIRDQIESIEQRIADCHRLEALCE
ncbi:AAA family ATPase [Ruegeria arenilitoris]|uniref:AAA family ATPase n=1 Tax=Ruegeria arenilitoris TaxID=1173585 RepID=UPI001C2C9A7E|nr:AAA family ATPase [Ruegeria arenilitoris]